MKKILGNIACAVLLISLSGCTLVYSTSTDKEVNSTSVVSVSESAEQETSAAESETPAAEISAAETPAAETSAAETTAAETTAEKTSAAETTKTETTEAETLPEVVFENVDDYVYSTVSLNVRTGPGKSYPVAGCLEKGEKVYRTGIGDNGWFRIVYDDEIRYASGNLMTTEYSETKPESQAAQGDDGVYTAVDETVYPTIILNVRTGPGTGYRKVGGFEKGEAVHRVAVGSNGWSKVEFRGGIYFASSEYLSTTKVKVEETAASGNTASGSGTARTNRSSSGEKVQVTGRWSGSNVRLDWSACDGVEKYIIYRRADWQKYEVDKIASGSGQAFTDTTAVSDSKHYADKGVLGTETEYYEYYICAKGQNGKIEELGKCRIYMNR